MIEVNLIPGGRKKRSGRGLSLSLPKFGGGGGGDGGLDGWVIGAVAAWILALGYVGLTWTGKSAQIEELEVRLETAEADSVRFAAQSARIATLRARRDSINDRIAVIQEIDQGRYIWAHVMDEIARALPDYTWVEGITASSPEPNPGIEIEGYAGTPFAVALFMEQLEASPFFEDVQLVSSQAQETGQGDAAQRVQLFFIEVSYVQPPFEMLESVPLFDDAPGPAENPLVAAESTDTLPGGV